MEKRVILIVLDSLGIGGAPDAAEFGDEGSDTLRSLSRSAALSVPNLKSLGLFNIDGVEGEGVLSPTAAYGRMTELSRGKDTTIGHWELVGVVSEHPLPTYPNGFPKELLQEFSRLTGRGVLCNKPYSGTEVIKDFGEEHAKTGALIIYTSADSVFQIAANEEVVPLEELYRYCEIARELLQGEHGVGRVIARPFVGKTVADFKRTSNRHDYSLQPPQNTVLDELCKADIPVVGVGKIYDIFAGRGVSHSVKTTGNDDAYEKLPKLIESIKQGLLFINLVDFDMVYGHRNDVDGYAAALSRFDAFLPSVLQRLTADDLLIITADHGCDPGTPSTDHSRECVPVLIYGRQPHNLGTIQGFTFVADTIRQHLPGR